MFSSKRLGSLISGGLSETLFFPSHKCFTYCTVLCCAVLSPMASASTSDATNKPNSSQRSSLTLISMSSDAFFSRAGLLTSRSSVRRDEMAKQEEFCRGAVVFEDGSLLLLLMGVNPLPAPRPPPFLLLEEDNDEEVESTATGALNGACGLPRGVGGNFEETKRPLLQWARHQASSSVAGERSRP